MKGTKKRSSFCYFFFQEKVNRNSHFLLLFLLRKSKKKSILFVSFSYKEKKEEKMKIKIPKTLAPIKRALEAFGSWMMRIVSGTNAPDAPSGFRAYSRFAALHLQVFNRYSYTLETLIQAGKENMKLAHLPIITNPTTRPSRLHKGILNFIWRQSGTIIRSYVLYQPLKTFLIASVPFLLSSFILIGRFLYFYFTNQSGVGRYIQSVSIGGTLGIFGLMLATMGLLGDVIRTNRQMMEEIIVHQRDAIRLDESSSEISGYRILRRAFDGSPKPGADR